MTGRSPDPQRWQRLTELFDQALELDATGRHELLENACGGDEELRAHLQRMLSADEEGSVLDTAGAAAVRAQVDDALRRFDDGADLIGQRVGIYRIERLLACGGMGRVFLAVRDDGEFEQRVALKLLRSGLVDDLARRRFLEERRVLARLGHTHIARLHDGGLGPRGEPWYAMEYIDGAMLTGWCDARGLTVAARLDLFRKVCEAVDYAHRHLVIHRDIKPGNLLVDADGNPKLLDFGIAKLIARQDAQTRNDTGLMTPEYAAPEQLHGGAISTATDIYSLGAVLFELLTGRRPFADPLGPRDPPSLLRACNTSSGDVQSRAVVRATDPKHLRAALRGDLERILRAALDPDPARRYRSAAELSKDLHRHLRGRPISLRRDRAYRFTKYVQRHRVGVAIGVVAVLALIATSALALWQERAARVQARDAEAVKDFMVGVFASADPGQHTGTGPSARALLDAGARQMQRQFSGDPEIEAALARALTQSYAGIGAYDQARTLAQHALVSLLKLHGAGSAEALAARIDYAEILQGAGLRQQARQQADIVLRYTGDAAIESSVRAHLVIAASDNDQLARDAQAQSEAKRALVLAQTLGAKGDRWQAAAWNDLAQTWLGRDDYDAAQRALREAATLYAHSPGENAAETLDARTNLIFVLLHSGHADEALDLYANLVAQQRRVLGTNHPALAETLSNYAYVLWSAGRFRQALQVNGQAQAALTAAVDMPAVQRGNSTMNLAVMERLRGDLPGALRLLDQVEQIVRPLEADAPRYLFSANWLQAALAAERGENGAIARMDALRAQAQRLHYPMGFKEEVDWPLAWLAIGQPQLALQRYRELFAILPDTHSHASHQGALLLGEGIALVQLNRFSEAKTSLDAALAAFADKPEDGARMITAQLWRGWMAVRLNRPQAGLGDIETALSWRSEQFGDDSYLTAEARLAHAEALSRLGRRNDALHEQQRARAVLDVALAPSHVLRQRADAPLPR